MLRGNRKKFKISDVETVIGQKTIMHGDVLFSGGLHVEGAIKGNVIADDDPEAVLILGERGTIEGEVKVPHVVLNGSVTGDVHAGISVELSSRARVNGSVFYKMVEMAMGAEVNGNLVHLEEEQALSEVSKSDLAKQELRDEVKRPVEFEVKGS